ncbi:MAG: thioredoxin domain-containing protein [Deltaproteobacteria bacterium]|nr:thioredoxin domain-containing protein [Deltaproteobacteria bacterium]
MAREWSTRSTDLHEVERKREGQGGASSDGGDSKGIDGDRKKLIRTRRLAAIVALVLALAGLGVSADLTRVHVKVHEDPNYRSFCAYSQKVNCDTVAESPYSVAAGVPVSVWGLFGYLLMAAAAAWTLKRSGRSDADVPAGTLMGLAGVSVAVSAVMAFISLTRVHAICILCFTSYGLNVLLLITSVWLCYMVCGVRDSITRTVGFYWQHKALSVLSAVVLFGGAAVLVEAYPKYWQASGEVGPQGLNVGLTESGDHWIGAAKPLVTIVEYSDYECPFCRGRHHDVRRIVAEHPGKVRLIHRHFPLDQACNPMVTRPFHRFACRMALMAACAGRQHRFWQANDLLFQWPRRDLPPDLGRFARKAGLDRKRFRACVAQSAAMEDVRRDIQAGLALHLRGTPTFFIDRRRFVGRIPKKVVRNLLVKRLRVSTESNGTGSARPTERTSRGLQ